MPPMRRNVIRNMNKPIPAKFYKGDQHPVARNVGELKALLNELPDDLAVEAGFSDEMTLVVYNYATDLVHLQIEGNSL